MSAPVSHEDVKTFRNLVTARLGLLFDDGKLEMLAEIFGRRAAATGLTPDHYLARLDGGSLPGETAALAQDLTVTETYFFRNAAQFHALREVVLPDRMAARGHEKALRFLSAGCASGEEAYSIAMTIREVIADPGWDIRIQAADINPAMLRKAREGCYSAWSLRDTSPEMQERWFRADGRNMILDRRILKAVDFQELNLISGAPNPLPPEGYDAIFCRNMLMYFPEDTARAVVARLTGWLARGGYLFLGHAETLRNLSQDFHLRHTHESFYYQRKDGGPGSSSAAAGIPLPPVRAPEDRFVPAEAWISAIRRSAQRIQALTSIVKPTPPPPAERTARIGAALELLARERFDDALNLVEQFPPEHGADPDVLLLKATLLSHRGQLEAAERISRRLLQQDELSTGGHYVLALCREAAGDSDEAADHYQLAAYLDPAFAMPRLRLGLLFRRLGQRETARKALTSAASLLEREDSSRLLFFGGGFGRDALLGLCRSEMRALEELT